MTAAIDLAPEHRETVLALLRKHLPGAAAWAYGSRTQWTAKLHSDLDLAVFPAPRQARAVADLREAFEESNLPFRVDLFVWDEIPAEFHARIESTHVPLAQGDTVRTPDRRARPARGGWRTAALGECIEVVRDTYSRRDNWPRIAYLDTGSIVENRISRIQILTPGKDKIPPGARRKAYAGDIVYSMVRPNRRHFGFLKTVPDNFLVSTAFFVFRGKPDVASSEFLYWFMTQDRIVEYLHSLAEQNASTYPKVKPTDFDNILVELPPIDRQHRIAGVLGALDRKIELNRKTDGIVDAMALEIFTDWFVNFGPVRAKMRGSLPYFARDLWSLFPERLVDTHAGELPVGWRTVALGECIEAVRETYSNRDNWPCIAYLDTGSIVDNRISHVLKLTPGKDKIPTRARKKAKAGDIVYSMVRPNQRHFGFLKTVPDNFLVSTGFFVFRGKPNVASSEFLYWFLAQDRIVEYLHSVAEQSTSAYPSIKPADLENILVELPPIEQQRRFASIMSALHDKTELNRQECRALASVRDALLPQLMSGAPPIASIGRRRSGDERG